MKRIIGYFLLLTIFLFPIPGFAGKKLFSFVHCTDPHTGGPPSGSAIWPFFDELRDFAEHVDFLFVTGDIAETNAGAEDFKEAIDSACTIPYYIARGNHDCYLPRFRQLFGMENYYFDHKGHRFMVINTHGGGGTIPSTAYEFLDSALALTDPATRLIGISHHPIAPEAPYRVDDAHGDSVIAKFANYNLIAWFNGHSHSWHKTVYNGVYYFTTDGMQYADNPWTTDKGYRLVNVWDDSISAEQFEVGNPPTDFIPNDPGSLIEADNRSWYFPKLTLSIFPNPFQSATRINILGQHKPMDLFIYDINGKLVKYFKNIETHVDWKPHGLSNGLYIVKTIIDGKNLSMRFLFQK